MNYPWSNIGEKLTDYDIPRIGDIIGVGEDEIHAVLDVETKGSGFDKNGVIRLFESHIFFREVPIAKRSEAVKLGLAHRTWREAKAAGNYHNNYERFLKAYELDKDAAMRSSSWGLGQIMGFNCRVAGYNTAHQMVRAFAENEANQLMGMVEFIKTSRLDDELRRHDWSGFARGYNGIGYKDNRYDSRLAARYKWWSKKPDTKWSPDLAQKEEENHAYNDYAANTLLGKPLSQSKTVWGGIVAAGTTILEALGNLNPWISGALIAIAVIAAIVILIERRKKGIAHVY